MSWINLFYIWGIRSDSFALDVLEGVLDIISLERFPYDVLQLAPVGQGGEEYQLLSKFVQEKSRNNLRASFVYHETVWKILLDHVSNRIFDQLEDWGFISILRRVPRSYESVTVTSASLKISPAGMNVASILFSSDAIRILCGSGITKLLALRF